METTLKQLLDNIYELEGLVHLALKRNEEADELLRLITRKGKEIEKACDIIYNQIIKNTEEPKHSDSFFAFDDYSLDEDKGNNSQDIDSSLKDSVDIHNDRKDVSKSGKLIFSINEKFRYKKELFNNSDVEFNNTLALIASMENFEEAEDYFINEEGFDYSNPIVKEFLELLKKYFQ